ncbi:phosphotransferase [Ornithinimicrobium cerasi]|uniref:Phosphotransferase enzyme family protein n=1 Tax=Ornithinimicrobium cerasi TaxID=2248773 RepID=A0A285VSL2_9MICO|nr:phosphotransferase [Ornithinimicrobium cerasi]SOC56857.1 Phosphotransferase enzyme family protein [Ornithinimicrobium cerasi]
MSGDPALALLLDPAWLSALVGAPVRATRLRPKPGVSSVAALVSPDGSPWGWVRTLTGPARAKAAKGRAAGRVDGVAEWVIPGTDTLVQWGPVPTDPRLGRYAARLPLGAHVVVLRHNPLRRLVVRDGPLVHRVTAAPHRRRLSDVTRALARAGVPVVTPVRGSEVRSSHVTTWPWVDGRDAVGEADPAVLREVGASLARLHAVRLPVREPSAGAGRRRGASTAAPGALQTAAPRGTPAPAPRSSADDRVVGPLRDWLPERTWADVVGAAAASVEQLRVTGRPELVTRARAVLRRVGSAGPTSDEVVVSHGDFSLDQCLLPVDGGVLLTDLDRAALAPRELDLAGLIATCLLARSDAGVPVLQGYADAAGLPAVPDVPGPWVAAALLARVVEPWRRQEQDWVAGTGRLVGLAEAALSPGATTGGLHGAPPVGRLAVPEVVTDGTEEVRVGRAWPGKVRDGIPRVVVEGRDGAGRLRAGTWDAAGRTRLLPPGADPALPALADVDGELVVHRAGRRAVVRRPDAYTKVVRPGRGSALARACEAGRLLATAAGLGSPEVLRAGEDVVDLSVVPGRPLHELADRTDWGEAWECWAEAWMRFQGVADGPDLPVHGDADEAAVLRTWAQRAAPLLTGTPWPDRLEALATALTARAGSGLRPVPTHRDLHDKQLLWDGATLSVLDLDTACLASPALDPANLAAHASLRQAQGLWSATAAGVVRDHADRVATAAGVSEEEWRLAEAATVGRLVGVYAHRPRWRRTVEAWAERSWRRLVDESSLMEVSPASPAGKAS